ncbi:MAG: GxxExxY protein [Verrucomicrobiota bacterium]
MLQEQELTGRIIACGIEVHRMLGPGFLESIYEQALREELLRNKLHFRFQEEQSIFYKGISIGTHRLDLIVEEKVIVELKAIKALEDVHFLQVRSYLKAWNIDHGLLFNFSTHPLTIKRVFRETTSFPAFPPSVESPLRF